MTVLQIVVGILSVAAVTAVLYVWGLRKSMNCRQDMDRQLLSACAARVVKALRKQSVITQAEAAKLIEGVTVGPVWSRSRLTVKNGEPFAPQVIAFLLEELYIEKDASGGYRLK